mmetsp:Transcript_120886/g.170044  ORF Transcript_120886/g.170044 Transcript_120886/m.170044 type:complete len:119 (-) Transcript_120886:79-435(-)
MAFRATHLCGLLAMAMVALPESLSVAASVNDPKEKADKPPIVGGWTPTREPNDDDLAVWTKVVKTVNTDLASKGTPQQVSTQVVAGIKYKFMFEDGSSVTVLSQPWMDTLDVLEVQEP